MNNPQKDLIFALDIGTRSVIGIVGETRGEMFHVLYMAKQEHSRRAMVDGQIEDIDQVAKVVTMVKQRLEEDVGHPLTRVCVAAAGRSLCMERARAVVELPEIHTITDELISQLEAVAIAEAEEKLSEHNKDQRFYLVGYTVAQYILDRYPMTTIRGHNGQSMEADVVATFLPSQVVEGLYAVVQMAGMEVASLTLEPIAALNATIPPDLRLLNLALVDIGAGTSDIAVCRDGSVVGYTMATTAGDEITEMLMKHFLVDFATAENLKTNLNAGDLKYVDVLGLEQITSGQQISEAVATASRNLVKEIAKEIHGINGCAPSAVFMAGGGSKLEGITQLLAETLELQPHRIAVAGNNYNRTIVAENFQLEDPEYATPLGIAVSAGLGLINDSYHITLNGKGAKLFRSGSLTILDILMMNGYTAAALIGRTGKNLALMINGNKKIIRGKPSVPGVLKLNGDAAVAGALVSAGDVIEFVPAIDGLSASSTLQELLGDYAGRVLLNGNEAPWDTLLRSGDSITTVSSPVQFTRRPRPLTEDEINPIDADGNPLRPLADEAYYQEMIRERLNEDGVDYSQLSGRAAELNRVENALANTAENASLAADDDVKIYATEDNITPMPLDMEQEEKAEEEEQLPPPLVPSFGRLPEEEEVEKPVIKKLRDYPTPEEVAIPMPPSEGNFESSNPENGEQSSELAPTEEEEDMEHLAPVIKMSESMENVALQALGEEVSVSEEQLEEMQKSLGEEIQKAVEHQEEVIEELKRNAPPEEDLAEELSPEVLEEPEVMEEMEVLEEPEIFPEPEITEEPDMMEEPEVFPEPEIMEEPEVLPEPEMMEAPEVFPEPEIMEEPEVVPEPEVMPEPMPEIPTTRETVAAAVPMPGGDKAPLTEGRIVLNGKPLQLFPKGDGSPYYLMDLLDKTDIDFRNVSKPIRMLVNGKEGYFVQQIHASDDVLIQEQE